MGIPVTQIETWSAQGAITTSKNTYASVKTAVANAYLLAHLQAAQANTLALTITFNTQY